MTTLNENKEATDIASSSIPENDDGLKSEPATNEEETLAGDSDAPQQQQQQVVLDDTATTTTTTKTSFETTATMTVAPTSPKASLVSCGTTSTIREILCSEDGIIARQVLTKNNSNNLPLVTTSSPASLTMSDNNNVDDDNIDDDSSSYWNELTEDSDISPPHRRIWVVTTAALPWRTGTAVNPLLRALYLTRGRPQHYVTLVIPWLEKQSSREQLYGKSIQEAFADSSQQEEWIRQYCRERAHCEQEEPFLKIQFYKATYNKAFGSIFPTEDICSLIPNEQADVAILEEPEHLNWFRVPKVRKENKKKSAASRKTNDTNKEELTNNKEQQENTTTAAAAAAGEELMQVKSDVTESSTVAMVPNDMSETSDAIANENNNDNNDNNNEKSLGWAHKFRHVVGILHTNYSAYMTQYAIGTSFIAAPAISMLSSIVVRAYCHRVIRLSDVLPSLAPGREVTCNVHGVRSEFLDAPNEDNHHQEEEEDRNDHEQQQHARVYFIGKLIWAKGFDQVLEMQDLFREATGEYLAMDVYGGGPDETAIRRAFHGRKGEPTENGSDEHQKALAPSEQIGELEQAASNESDASAAAIFENKKSIRKQVSVLSTATEASDIASIEVEPVPDSPTRHAVQVTVAPEEHHQAVEAPPIAVLGELGSTSVSTGVETSQAVYGLAESLVKAGLKMTFSKNRSPAEEKPDVKKSFFLDPPKSRYEWRRNPIPARFLGVKDHVIIRDIPAHTIFLNMSITEVLCTTTAEALAMGKWAIIPKHPSNTFFLQFQNCLAYESLPECVEKVRFALENSPTPLTEDERHKFTWDGANERLFKAAGITRRELRERHSKGIDETDSRIAWFHENSIKTGNLIRRVFSNNTLNEMDESKEESSKEKD